MPVSDLYLSLPQDRVRELPSWAQFLGSIGTQVATAQGGRAVAAVALPTRAYAAPLVASGITLARACDPVTAGALEEYFLQLCQLPRGTRIVYIDRNKRHKGVLAGVEILDAEPRLRVQLTTGDKLAYLISAGQSKNVELSDWEGELPQKEAGRRIARRFGFIETALGDIDSREFISKSRLDVLVLGKLNALRAEIVETDLSARQPNGCLVTGTFQDLIRVRSFSPTQAFRSDVMSDSAQLSEISRIESRVIVVFDGPRAFLKFREAFSANHWIVLLDRTNVAFHEAADALNQAYMRAHRAEQPDTALEGRKSWGVEVMMYWEQAA